LNKTRTYTLSSWDANKKYLDLVISIVNNGLTSTYFQSFPEYIRIRPVQSSFYIPEGRPIVMIANGSGIAPFRSIT
jgi:NAD(P)H-flavin reductase